jgi:hypothetical protein
VISGQTLSLHREHGENTAFRHCALPSLVGRKGGDQITAFHRCALPSLVGRGLRVSVLIIYFLGSCTKPSRAKYTSNISINMNHKISDL